MESIIVEDKSNASLTKKGFNYQDVVALSYLLRDIENLESINIEGKEDVDLFYEDKKTVYMQVKMAENVLSKRRSEALNNTLRVLINDFDTKGKVPDEVIYLTNSHYPFATQKDFDFSKDYTRYGYRQLNESIRKKIMDQVRNLKNEKDKRGRIGKNKFIRDLNEEGLEQILDKLSIVKFRYEGEDDQSKLVLLKEYIETFTTKIRIKSRLNEVLKDAWYFMISRSSEDEKKKIKKEDFVAQTFVTVSLYENDDETFFDKCELDFPSMNYIRNQADELRSLFLHKFTAESAIMGLYTNFAQKNHGKKLDGLADFLNQEINEVSEALEMDISDGDIIKIDTVKYIAWTMISQSVILNTIEKVSNYDN